jgi:hypothetical protein
MSTSEEPLVSDLEQDLAAVINKHSMDNGANTPDFILARYIIRCLDNFRELTQERERWYGVHLEPGKSMRNEVGSDNLSNKGTVGSTSEGTGIN